MKKKSTNILISLVFILTFLIVLLSTIKRFSLAADADFNTEIYTINNNIITGISPNTSTNLFKKYFDLNNCYLKITDENNIEISSVVYTGSKTHVYNSNNSLINSYTNIITGDITKDGVVNVDDTTKLGEYLNNEVTLTEYEIKAADINKDGTVSASDIERLNELLNSSYSTLQANKSAITLITNGKERIIPTITPNIILNQNLNWTSSNNGVATVDDSGVVTAISQGEAVITLRTQDNSLSQTVTVTVDNRPKLPVSELKTYRGAYDTELNITAINYNELTCSVDNPEVASCRIENQKLIITPIVSGITTVNLISPTYGTTTLPLEVIFTSFSIHPKSQCLKPYQSASGGIISGFGLGRLSVKSISDRDIVSSAFIFTRNISVESGSKTGDGVIVFTESNGHNDVEFTVKVYILELSVSSGTTPLNGKKLVAQIINENAGELTCQSSDNYIATCKIENGYLTVNPINEGTATINITGSNCGSTTYTATITERLDDDNYLKSLKVDGETITPAFSKEVSNYELTTDKSNINISATKNSELSTLGGDIGSKELAYGLNIYKITVTSQLGEERTYSLFVTRPLPKTTPKSDDKKDNKNEKDNKEETPIEDISLNDIEIDNYNIKFDKNTFKYEVTVKGDVNDLDISAIPTSKNSKVEIEKPKTLKVGENIITITVTGKDGTKCKYVIVANKKELSYDTSIKDIIIKGYELNYQKDKYDYDLPIKSDNKLDIKVILNDPNSTYKIEGNKNLKNNSIITITVTSEAKTTKEYKINILKDQYSNNKIINNIPLASILGILLIVTSLFTLIRKRVTKK